MNHEFAILLSYTMLCMGTYHVLLQDLVMHEIGDAYHAGQCSPTRPLFRTCETFGILTTE
jgi:hypothetical protein